MVGCRDRCSMKSIPIWLIAIGAFAGVVILRIPAPVVPALGDAPQIAVTARGIDAAHPGASAQTSIRAQARRAPDRREHLVRDMEAALVSVDDRKREHALDESLRHLMVLDPSAAARIFERAPHGSVRDELRDRIARLWAAADPNGALEWVTGLEDDDDRRLATTEIRSHIAASHPGTAIEISDLMDVGRDDGSLAHIAQMWAEENGSAAMAWAEAQPPGPLRDELLGRIALVTARSNATRAANLRE
jgi:hypothetical protein